jgi:TPR repeat protein
VTAVIAPIDELANAKGTSSFNHPTQAVPRKSRCLRLVLASGVALLLSTFPAHSDYRKGLQLYLADDIDGAVQEFQQAAEEKRYEGYQDVIRSMQGIRNKNANEDASAKILRLLGRAAEEGSAESQWLMSRLWKTFVQNLYLDEQLRWLVLAANGGHKDAAWALWFEASAATPASGKWLIRAAELGHTKAQTTIMRYYYYGASGLVEQNEKEAFRFAKLLGEKREPEGMAWLGYFYAGGKGVEQNISEAVQWLRNAWDAGYRNFPGPDTLIRLHELGLVPSASADEVASWREHSLPRRIID